jgi:NTE family protein
MDADLINLLKSSKIFSSLDEAVLKTIAEKLALIELKYNDILFYQGDPADSIFLLSTGRVLAQFTTASGATKTVGYIEPGETVGELGALSGEPRTLTIKAVVDSTLFKLASKDFSEICFLYPSVMLATLHPVVKRTQNIIQMLSSEQVYRHIVLIPAHKDMKLTSFFNKFFPLAEHFSSLILVSDLYPDFQGNDPALIREKLQNIHRTKKPSQKILYLLSSTQSTLARIALHKAEKIYVLANSDISPRFDSLILEKMKPKKSHFPILPELVLLHPEGTRMPHNTIQWLSQATFHLHHHIHLNKVHDYHRLLRFIRGKAVGVVLGGGGTRGWAHLGVIKALREQKISIDMIGGTSVGAIVAGCYAIHESYDEAHDRFRELVETSIGSTSWRSLTWPIISLFDAKKFTLAQQRAFKDIHVEDLWLPYFCISSNLATYREDVHRTGLLWEKTRCSSAIPGIIPPMVLNGELHLDGGLLNNLPVDVMRNYIGREGKIIAVELIGTSPDRHKYNFPPILTLKEAILSKLGMTKESYKFPRFIETFLRGFLIGSSAKTQQNSLAASIMIDLNLSKFRLLHSNTKQAEKMIEIGYLETMLRLHQLKNKSLQ